MALAPTANTTANPYTSPAYVDAVATRLAQHEAQLGGAPLAREAVRHASRVIPVARSGGPALAAAASRLCRQSALILHDVRKLGQAETTARAALALGLSAGHTAASASALACDVLSMTTAHLPDGRGDVRPPGAGAGRAGRCQRGHALRPGSAARWPWRAAQARHGPLSTRPSGSTARPR